MNYKQLALLPAVAAVALALSAPPAGAGTLAPRLARLAASGHGPARAVRTPSAASAARKAPFAPRLDAAGRVQVYLRYQPGAGPDAAALAQAGARRVLRSAAMGVIQAWVPVSALHRVAALPGVRHVGIPAYGYPKTLVRTAAPRASSVSTGLDINGQALLAEKIDAVQQLGIKGAGEKIGVISNGIDGLSASQSAGYLPSGSGAIFVPSSRSGSGAEGTAMLEEIHAAAPDASLGFCGNGLGITTAEFLDCYDQFATWGASVIVDDLGFPDAFTFGNPDAQSFLDGITTFAQNHPDINLVTATGNDRQDYFQGGYSANTNPNTISLKPSYTVPPSTGGTPNRTYHSALDFGQEAGSSSDTVNQVKFASGCDSQCKLLAILTWNDPSGGPYDDLDLFLVKQDGTVVASSTFDQTSNANNPPGSGQYTPPAEVLTHTYSSSDPALYLAVLCYSCPNASNPNFRVKLYGNLNGGGAFQYTTDGSVAGHAGLAAEFSAGAARSSAANGSAVTMETFSATGPYLYGSWDAALQTNAKPDITGVDGVTVSGAGGFSSPFYGTSAAAPNVAVVETLMRGQYPGAAADANGWNKLVSDNASASIVSNYSQKASGAGLVDAQATAAAIDGTLTASITAPSGSPVPVQPSTDVTFTGNCSYTGQQTLSYQWQFGAGTGIPSSTKLNPDPVQFSTGGIYTVKFTCSDPLQSTSATKKVAVQAAATASDQSLSGQQDQNLDGQVTGTGIGGEAVSYAVTKQPAHGSLQLKASDGTFVYSPDSGYNGQDSFQFDIDNGVQTSNAGTVSITVKKAPSGGGGGGFGGLGLALLALAALALRRRR